MKQLFKACVLALPLATLACSSTVNANYFKDDFSWGHDTAIWNARSGDNGSPFGCTFKPEMINPSSHGITLSLSNGQCSELQSKNHYGYGQIQGSLKTGNTPGTVSSIFTYTSWYDEPGRAWQEIDIEFLPSLGNVVHTNVIYQPQNGTYESWELDIDLAQYGLNIQQNLVSIGFDWGSNQIQWYVWDSNGAKQILRTVYKDNGDGHIANDEIPAYAWPVDPTKIMINHWHGDNSQNAFYFPGQYAAQAAWAYYDYIEYVPH
ncbi:family 16 glycosylhydrolase [Catenovulum sp. 2E275]|uniref:family 16 glycosylhydrolase n=1 Tax=Catenovulum sp. 2E275 TaxID=2980497 RepID=UPI0021CF9BE4|nr:family 16 glycosylhydrolase [Catenovulum sp. 2E275]MCU4674054.1 family 16 glycosylhydrolase [Catenovulum sp. 2E275]